jgi:pilus assembly protein CpaE
MSRLVLATADTDFEQRVRDAFEGELHGPLSYWRDELLVDPSDAVRELGGRGVEVVALGPDVATDDALALATAFDQSRPDISVVIIAPPSTDLLQEALRAGARDVIAPDMAPADLRAAIERAFDTATHRRRVFDGDDHGVGEEDPRRVVMALCPKGGAGKTTISTNLALALAQVAPGEVVILDLDVQFGDVASALGLRPDLTLADAVRSIDTLDATSLKAHLTIHPQDDLFVLCAPATPTEADEITIDEVERVVELLTQSFKYVVVDTASGLDENTLAALEFATDLLLISATDVPSIRATVKEIEALRVIGKPQHLWHFVLNRADARTGLTIPAIERTVGINVDVAIPSSRSVPLSLNQGEPLVLSDPRAAVSLAMLQLVRRLAPQAAPADTRPTGIFRRR